MSVLATCSMSFCSSISSCRAHLGGRANDLEIRSWHMRQGAREAVKMSKGIQKCQSFDIVRFERWCATAARHREVVCVCLHHRNPACRVQQLVLPLAPLAQLGRVDGVAAQVQERLGSLAEAFTGKFS